MKPSSLSQSSPRPEISPTRPVDQLRRCVQSADLFGRHREVQIEHAGELYTLRHTSKGKLILTK